MIKTTHVGSLPRSQEVVDFIFARENESAFEQDAFDATMTAAVSETVRKQAEAGIEVIAFDADTSKSWLDTAQTAGWDAVAAIDEKIAADLKPCLTE